MNFSVHAGPPNHHDDKVDSDQQVIIQELSFASGTPLRVLAAGSTSQV
jgi:hypothetical protein